MNDPRHIRIDDYHYQLPDERIAKYPLANRDESKLLVYQQGHIFEKQFLQLPELLHENDTLVFNNTKVIQARLLFHKASGARIEIFCLEPLDPHEYVLAFESKKSCTWKCLIGNAKKWKEGELNLPLEKGKDKIILTAQKAHTLPDAFAVEFSWDNPKYSFGEILEMAGILPIPPYLNRETETQDYKTYQTVYSQIKGSVAAPTAGLHFSDGVISNLKSKGISIEEVTLHVGAGTFKPVSTERIGEHAMHSEQFFITWQNIENLLNRKGRLIAVGTTSVRTIESLYWMGLRILQNKIPKNWHISQWAAYDENPDISPAIALEALLEFMLKNNLEQLEASTQIMITPAYKFKLVEGLITNFHLPKSTLLLLIASLIGPNWKRVYDFALENDFRFLSYGDSSLLLP
ncbi:MAG: S-adenosylmethionine:tRNA ribosyltransferase-isomerase [Bacteroidales bacterium]|nr:S-adenosylmethionine:tRNA ribosyltransferase-isomerase [Bacteroidales bacterium]MCF8455475.1 S-adenosylmethionine:tRNA ribosyltransferase-isomerase [Bacteroidales bacterium]